MAQLSPDSTVSQQERILDATLNGGRFWRGSNRPVVGLDIQGKHRLDPTRIVAECKAHKKKMGGAELNKFIGVLTVEKDASQTPMFGYFVSLGGFTGPAVELVDPM